MAFFVFVYELVKYAGKNTRTSDAKRRGSSNKYIKKKCRNRHKLFLRAESARPDASKFETFIPLVPLVIELELFQPKIGVSVFGSETRITRPIAPKICTKNDSYVPQLRAKFQASNFSRFKVIAFFIFVYKFVKYAGKNIGTSDKKRRGSPNKISQKA